jgi:hypothetical protein
LVTNSVTHELLLSARISSLMPSVGVLSDWRFCLLCPPSP